MTAQVYFGGIRRTMERLTGERNLQCRRNHQLTNEEAECRHLYKIRCRNRVALPDIRDNQFTRTPKYSQNRNRNQGKQSCGPFKSTSTSSLPSRRRHYWKMTILNYLTHHNILETMHWHRSLDCLQCSIKLRCNKNNSCCSYLLNRICFRDKMLGSFQTQNGSEPTL